MNTNDTELSQILKQIGIEFSEANPSTFSAFFTTAFRRAGAAVKNRESIGISDLSVMFEAAVIGILKLDRVQASDETLLDALIPASEAVRDCANRDSTVPQALCTASEPVETGMSRIVTTARIPLSASVWRR